jgi:hypothetical protein
VRLAEGIGGMQPWARSPVSGRILHRNLGEAQVFDEQRTDLAERLFVESLLRRRG